MRKLVLHGMRLKACFHLIRLDKKPLGYSSQLLVSINKIRKQSQHRIERE